MGIDWILLGQLGKAALTGIATSAGKAATEEAIKQIKAGAEASGESITQREQSDLELVLSGQNSAWKDFVSSLRPTDDRGIVIIGPSGSGKTQVWRTLTGATPVNSSEFTARAEVAYTRLGTEMVKIVDTPGDPAHELEETVKYLKSGHARLIVIVLAWGYLDSAGIPETQLRRPDRTSATSYSDLDAFLAATRKEELQWLEWMRVKVPTIETTGSHASQCLVVVNKRDLWDDESADAFNHYKSAAVWSDIERITSAWSMKAPVLQSLATTYDSFKLRQAPSAAMSSREVHWRRRLFRAQLALQLKYNLK